MDEVVLAGVTGQLKALAEPSRWRILALLRARGEVCVCEIWPALGATQSNTSMHLRVLREAGLIRGRKQGKWVYYSLEEAAVAGLLASLQDELGTGASPAAGSAMECCAGPGEGEAEGVGPMGEEVAAHTQTV